MSTFGDRLIRIRRERGVSQEALADRAGMQRSHLSKIENGRITQPSPNVVRRIAAALDVAADELYAEEAQSYDADAAEIARVIARWTPEQRRWLLDLMDRTDAMLGANDTDDAA